jgi:chromosome segregation ATPase
MSFHEKEACLEWRGSTFVKRATCQQKCLHVQEDGDEVLSMLFREDTQPQQHSAGGQAQAQLVTVIITIHDDALQQALQQAQRDLQTAHAHSAELQAQADSLKAELHSAAAKLNNTSDLGGAYSAQSDAAEANTSESYHMSTELLTQNSEEHQLNEQNLRQSESATQSSDEGKSAKQGLSEAESTAESAEMQQLLQQLHVLLQQAGEAAAQHTADCAAVAQLQRQLSQQNSRVSAEQEANQTLRMRLESAEASVAESTTRIQQLR